MMRHKPWLIFWLIAVTSPEFAAMTVTLMASPGETISVGESLTLTCALTGNVSSESHFTFIFIRNNTTVRKNNESPVLIINNFSKSHAGKYRCAVKHSENGGYYSNEVRIKVKVPVLTAYPGKLLEEGDNLSLSCSWIEYGTSHSQLTYRFFQNKIVVQNSNTSVLIIENIHTGHNGNYSCAVDLQGQEIGHSNRINITVQAQDVMLTASPKHSVKVGDSLRFNCKWARKKSSALNITFFILKDDEIVWNSSNSRFKIDPINKSHTGSYTCAVELQGQMEYSNKITIEVEDTYLPIVAVGVGLFLGLVILPLLLYAYHRIQGLPCSASKNSRATGHRREADFPKKEDSAIQMDSFRVTEKETDHPDVTYSELVDFSTRNNKGKHHTMTSPAPIYSEIRVFPGGHRESDTSALYATVLPRHNRM
ncbi:carcinoembryonic antigen-related cell adhesion molecule 2-like isoform X2 [Erpetoichthys calabaricus]|uniref:carcinoembryonic antigen-related cell adhesion molecule 2-like isoform X2 n=1 Tax=Erpetoichthys calabaricus TaxID=27687 RepID=UPI00109F0A1E|nr:carcinoembryonic antigen-related cell adhesion molecule 2-like isoform X2 [Erpetoichthys calabaricus]